MENIKVLEKNICVTVDYWTELLGVMYVICEDEKVSRHGGQERNNKKYRQEIIDKFSCFSQHKAVKLLQKLSKEYYFNFDSPVLLCLQISNGNICRRSVCKGRRMIERGLFNEFVCSIKEFEKVCEFEKFYNEHIDEYKKYID